MPPANDLWSGAASIHPYPPAFSHPISSENHTFVAKIDNNQSACVVLQTHPLLLFLGDIIATERHLLVFLQSVDILTGY
jgi:hypothetical protein